MLTVYATSNSWSEGQHNPTAHSNGSVCATASHLASESATVAAKLSANDPRVIDELILRYQDRLRHYLLRLTANRELAEDLMQETWMRVVTRGSQFKGNSQFVTWLFAIARNLAWDLHRRSTSTSSLDEFAEQGDHWEMQLTQKDKSPFDCYAATEHVKLVSAAVMSLRPDQRRLVELRFYKELSLVEIAEITEAPLSTVKARLYRALAQLRRRVETTCSSSAQTPQIAV